MKKLIALLISVSLIAGLSATTMAAVKKAPKKKVAKKIVKPVKKAVKKVAPKPAPAAPWVPPAPAPVAPAPTAPAAAAGMGMAVGVNVGVVAGATGAIGNFDYSIASILPGAKVRVGLDYLTGTNPTGNDSYKVSDVSLGLVYALDMLKNADVPINWYAVGSFLYPWKVSNAQTGSWGANVALGGSYNVPDFGTISAELGYAGLKYSTTQPALKGLSAVVGYSYSF